MRYISTLSPYKILAKGLGLLWLFDAFLQLQPNMFKYDFLSNVVKPTTLGQPDLIAKVINFGINVYSINTFTFNICVFLIQAFLGLSLLLFPTQRKELRWILILSIIWGLIIWIFGEGLGGIFTGQASLYSGAPGAAFVYILASIILLRQRYISSQYLAKIVGIIFILTSLLQFQPMFWMKDGLIGIFKLSSLDNISIISSTSIHITNLITGNAVLGNTLLIYLLLVLGWALVIKPNVLTSSIALLFLLFVWGFGQDLGTLSTIFKGTATDPNTAVILIMFLIPTILNLKLMDNENSKVD